MSEETTRPARRSRKAPVRNGAATAPETEATVPEQPVAPGGTDQSVAPAEAPADTVVAVIPPAPQYPLPFLTDDDLYLFGEGTHFRVYEKLGAHIATLNGEQGTYFAVWAPNAEYVAVIGDWNGWDAGKNAMRCRGNSGIWETFVPGVGKG
ncbi:MAG: hypothetical protein N2378_12550, partial [Chloroflexaceae bacterium]|nr:hypothetical protein [Chloroflexaceae bacterium]